MVMVLYSYSYQEDGLSWYLYFLCQDPQYSRFFFPQFYSTLGYERLESSSIFRYIMTYYGGTIRRTRDCMNASNGMVSVACIRGR